MLAGTLATIPVIQSATFIAESSAGVAKFVPKYYQD